MDEEFRTVCSVDGSYEISSANASPMLQTGTRLEEELPGIMASLELDENHATCSTKDTPSSSDSLPLRRSQRKQAVPRIVGGGVTKRSHRCVTQFGRNREIQEFFTTYNQKFKKVKKTCLETIYEEPKEKNGTIVLSGPKRRRSLDLIKLRQNKNSKRRQAKIKLLLLDSSKKAHFTIEDVKEHLADTGLVNLSAD